ncbi:hypothetical protein K491DRAFT_695903 [Lophiostoma macrostomum CBS 122681]|uniref:Uncharacterized protein n=1 Tax=Lophiostoma macrostomum CBS 122681 TaxID=1314788 RepID=A0A6A6SWK1_9PLEO|nr:hypothetical protein K491DRAFT_695903 [Lophiostoma macrostomum CBS 122681]
MPPNTSIPKIFMAGGIVGFGYYMVMRPYWFPNPYKTPGTQNVEDRFTAGGGTPYHTPAVATKRGDSKNTESRMETPKKGPDTEHFQERFDDQKLPSQPNVFPGKFYEQQLGNDKGK